MVKYIFLFFLFFSVFCSDGISQNTAENSPIKTDIREAEDGNILIKTTYRYGKRILCEYMNKKKPWKNSRSYRVGATNVIELDRDGDGIYETLFIYGEKLSTFDVFIKTKNGVEPISTSDLEELKSIWKQQQQEIGEALNIVFNEAQKRLESEKNKSAPAGSDPAK